MSVGCVLLAAGRSARMGGGDKLLAALDGRPVLGHSLAAIDDCAAVQHVVVVTNSANRADVAGVVRGCGSEKVRALVTGGVERQDSVAAGLAALPSVDVIVIHDGARPLVGAHDFAEGVQIARASGAAVAGAADGGHGQASRRERAGCGDAGTARSCGRLRRRRRFGASCSCVRTTRRPPTARWLRTMLGWWSGWASRSWCTRRRCGI